MFVKYRAKIAGLVADRYGIITDSKLILVIGTVFEYREWKWTTFVFSGLQLSLLAKRNYCISEMHCSKLTMAVCLSTGFIVM